MNGKEIREFLRFLKDNDASNAFIMSYRKAKFYDDEPMNEYLYSIHFNDAIISSFDWAECTEIKNWGILHPKWISFISEK